LLSASRYRRWFEIHHEMLAQFPGCCKFSEVQSHIAPESLLCLQVQLQLLETPWASSILSMKGCEEKHDEHGQLVFAGIRVRLGLHWASEGSVVVLFNEGTSTYNIQGPGMDAAVTISDSAHGGQSVMTGDVWNRVCINAVPESRDDSLRIEHVRLLNHETSARREAILA